MREQIAAALRASRADYTEIRLEERASTQVHFRGKELETASVTLDRGGIVRCLVRGGGWGVATFNDLDNLPRRVEQAYQGARAIRGEAIELASIPIAEEVVTVPQARDFRGVSLAEKMALARGYNDVMLDLDPHVVDTQTQYGDTMSRIFLATSEGFYFEEERPLVTLNFFATARQEDNIQQTFELYSRVAGFEAAVGQEALPEKAARRAVDLLRASRVKGGRYTVICNPVLAGVFAHEAFGHLSEADFLYADPRAREMMTLGRRFGSDILNIVDDGSLPGRLGTHRRDDEGTPTGRSELIRQGVLTGRLHSRETAGRMGERPTGNARATGYRYPPIVRMTNTFIEPGSTSFEEMIRDVDLGIYACDTLGGQTSLDNFSFSAAAAYMIREGQVAEMVRDVILSGNLFVTLQHVDAIGNDLVWTEGGGCGKGQGSTLPVGIGSPHIRIRDVLIGGE